MNYSGGDLCLRIQAHLVFNVSALQALGKRTTFKTFPRPGSAVVFSSILVLLIHICPISDSCLLRSAPVGPILFVHSHPSMSAALFVLIAHT
jgi:hypothetical protein